jgi:hypothetical protein
VHEGRVTIQVLDDGALRFMKADGRPFDGVTPGHSSSLSDWMDLSARHRAQGIHIDAGTAETLWRGEVMDYGQAVDGLLYKERRAQDVSAETRVVGRAESRV